MISIKKLFKVLIIGIFLLIFGFTIFTNISLNSNNKDIKYMLKIIDYLFSIIKKYLI